MEAKPTAEMALRHKGLIVGIKTAHYAGPEFTPVERAVEAGTAANIPVMVDFGRPSRHAAARRPADEEAAARRHLHPRVFGPPRRARRRQAEPRPDRGPQARRHLRRRPRRRQFRLARRRADHEGGFLPDSISTDLHVGSMNAGMKDMLNVMSKFLALGMSLDDVIARPPGTRRARSSRSTRPPFGRRHRRRGRAAAREGRVRLPRHVRRPAGRHAEADLRDDPADGRIVYDLNGLARPDWTTLPADYKQPAIRRWDGTRGR